MTNTNQTAIAIAMQNAGVLTTPSLIDRVTHGTAYFDPLELLEDKIGQQPMLHSRVLKSISWMIDNSCISQARTILFARYKDDDHEGITDPFGNFCQQIAADLSHESIYIEESNEHTLALLLALRQQWHDAAGRAAAADDQDYNPKSLRELMIDEKPQTANVGTRHNYQTMAHDEAMVGYAEEKAKAIKVDPVNGAAHFDDMIDAKIKRLIDIYLSSNIILQAQRAEGNKKLMPTILEILRTASRYASADVRFDHLPLSSQRRLTQFVVATVERMKVDLAQRLANQPLAFGRVSEAALNATTALNKVLATKFTEVGDLENTSLNGEDLEMARRREHTAKRKAIAAID